MVADHNANIKELHRLVANRSSFMSPDTWATKISALAYEISTNEQIARAVIREKSKWRKDDGS